MKLDRLPNKYAYIMLYIYAYLDIVSNRFSISNIPLPITDLTLYIKLVLIKLTSSLALL